MHVLHVVGARPNFMKAAPVVRALNERCDLRQSLIHTGQHYDSNMSEVFFSQLNIPGPDVNLEVGSRSQTRQTSEIMSHIEPVLLERKPDIVLVYGDVNSTVAAAIVCSKLLISIGHVEAGLRSFDRSMPEEVNRIVTDRLADLLFTTSRDGDWNCLSEGVEARKIHCVGNVMIDSLFRLLPAAIASPNEGLPDQYALATLHRPSSVDDGATLQRVLGALLEVSAYLHVVFPVHPRTRQRMVTLGLNAAKLHLLEPMPYIQFLYLMHRPKVVITDSGGIQEETTYLGVPCLTLRNNTERPITVDLGTNVLVGQDLDKLHSELNNILEGYVGRIPANTYT